MKLEPRGPFVSEIVVGVQAYNRPDLTWRTIRSLQLAAERVPWVKITGIGFIDRLPDGSVNPNIHDMFVNTWAGTLPMDHVIIPDRHLDANDGCFSLTEACFEFGDFVIHSEDDLVFSHDYLDYMACGFARYKDDDRVQSLGSLTVFGNDRTYHGVARHLYDTYSTRMSTGLYGAGWFRRTWNRFRPVWTPSGPLSLDVGLDSAIPESERYCVFPCISRCRHVGFYNGRYGPWTMDTEEQFTGYEKHYYIRWDSDHFHPKPVAEQPWNWVQPPEIVNPPS